MQSEPTTYEIEIPRFPGFYESVLSPRYDDEIWTINQDLPEDLEVTFDDIEWDESAYEQGVAEAWADQFLFDINRLLPKEMQGVCEGEPDIRHPRQYNYTTDRVFFKITVPDGSAFLQRLHDMLLGICRPAHDISEEDWSLWPKRIEKYLRANFTSGPGFCSFYPNDPKEFAAELLNSPDNISLSYAIGACLYANGQMRGDDWAMYYAEYDRIIGKVKDVDVNDIEPSDLTWDALESLWSEFCEQQNFGYNAVLINDALAYKDLHLCRLDEAIEYGAPDLWGSIMAWRFNRRKTITLTEKHHLIETGTP